jgi:hypothetical protein
VRPDSVAKALAVLECKVGVRDALLIGLVAVILGQRSADDLRDTLAESDREIESRA